VALMCSNLDLLSPFLGAIIYFVKFTQWSRQVKEGSLKVFDFFSPSKVRSDLFILPGKDISLLYSLAMALEYVGPKVYT
jgi:hypothetical protein